MWIFFTPDSLTYSIIIILIIIRCLKTQTKSLTQTVSSDHGDMKN